MAEGVVRGGRGLGRELAAAEHAEEEVCAVDKDAAKDLFADVHEPDEEGALRVFAGSFPEEDEEGEGAEESLDKESWCGS